MAYVITPDEIKSAHLCVPCEARLTESTTKPLKSSKIHAENLHKKMGTAEGAKRRRRKTIAIFFSLVQARRGTKVAPRPFCNSDIRNLANMMEKPRND